MLLTGIKKTWQHIAETVLQHLEINDFSIVPDRNPQIVGIRINSNISVQQLKDLALQFEEYGLC